MGEEKTPEQKSLEEIADAVNRIAGGLPSRTDRMIAQVGLDPKQWREEDREAREREQARLYRLVVAVALVSAMASVAAVIVAAVSA